MQVWSRRKTVTAQKIVCMSNGSSCVVWCSPIAAQALCSLNPYLFAPTHHYRVCPPPNINSLYVVLVRLATLIPLGFTVWVS